VPCKHCSSDHLGKLSAEMALHLRSIRDVTFPPVLVFPEVLMCLSCGFTEFIVPKDELRLIAKRVSEKSQG